MAIAVSQFGEVDGKPVRQFALKSDTGVEVDIIEYGVAVRDWRVPVKGGKRSVVLGFDRLEDYVAHSPHFGALAGRVANRIAGASFEIDGVTYHTDPNWHGHTLHGGTNGLGRVVWQGTADEAKSAVSFTWHSPDGDMGFPGAVDFKAVYTLTGNRLRLELSATTDRKTPISLVQHQYFNLGTGDDVLDHTIQIETSAYTQPGEMLIPTGAILPSRGTPYDLRAGRTMRGAGGKPVDYDLNVVLDQGRDLAAPVATVTAPDGSLTLRLWTDRPGLQVYNAVTTNVPVPGLNGKRYGLHSGFCLEDQSFPDAVHNPHFPSVWHSPERPYAHWCEFEIA
jgi:aldose 1-epimerase